MNVHGTLSAFLELHPTLFLQFPFAKQLDIRMDIKIHVRIACAYLGQGQERKAA